jgi:DivIVA domain-containing protein
MTRPATPLTQRELYGQSFERSWRGYDADQVDTFVARVRATLQRLQDERVQLVDRAANLEQENNSLRIKLGHLDAATQAQIVSDQTVNMMRTAQRQIEQSFNEAEQQCRQMAVEARSHYQHVVEQARLRAQTMLDEAHRQATDAGAAAAGDYRRQAGDYRASREEFERQTAYQQAFSGFWRRQFEAMLAEMGRTLDEYWPEGDRPFVDRSGERPPVDRSGERPGISAAPGPPPTPAPSVGDRPGAPSAGVSAIGTPTVSVPAVGNPVPQQRPLDGRAPDVRRQVEAHVPMDVRGPRGPADARGQLDARGLERPPE